MRRALLSVSDKRGLAEFARGLIDLGFEIVSTGGTARVLRESGLTVQDVSQVTDFPEIMDGRIKTLHPAIHGGLLARAGTDEPTLAQHGIAPIELLAVNLYPFEATVAAPDCSFAQAIENIDIGGPAMLRAAAKNHHRVTVLVDPDDYPAVLEALAKADEEKLKALRLKLAHRAFSHTAHYDSAIAGYLAEQQGEASLFPETLRLDFQRAQALRYGENPHQAAAFYRQNTPPVGSLAAAEQLQGKPLSYNNLADADAALQCVQAFENTACVIVKHANPCGVALDETTLQAYGRAFQTDPTSAFGGIIAFNRDVDGATAEAIVNNQFVEVLIAPAFSADAQRILQAKKNVRVLAVGTLTTADTAPQLKSVSGGLLVQEPDLNDAAAMSVVTKRQPSQAQWRDLRFGWQVAKHVKSNAIVLCAKGQTLGIGAGQMSRVVSTRIAAMKAEDEGLEIGGCVMASDAFFPFRDGLDVAARFGVGAVVQPGGSIRDDEVIQAADEHGLAMVFTGMRHFRH